MHEWTEAGVWPALHRVLLDELGAEGKIDWPRAAMDGSNVPARKGAPTRSARTRRMAVGQAQDTTSSSIAEAYRSRSR
jgi:hypothetical protein